MKKILLSALALVVGASLTAADRTATISIDNRIEYQHVTGFGGFSPSPQWQYWLGDTEMDKLFGKGENQLGLNVLRLYIANSRNGWSSGVANAKRAKKYGAYVFASPWSPPASWKSNNSESNGGELLESRWSDWATFLNDYYKYMKQQGVTIDAVSIQNEPDWRAEYQSCIWSGEQMARFLRLHGSKIECQIIAPEAIHFTRSMHEPILNDPDACAELDILGGHFYGWDGSSYPLAAQKGKEVWMTEYLINERQQNENKDINWRDDGFLFARSVNDAMLANMSAWVHYSLKRYYGCLGDGNFGTTNNQITKRGWILSHYAKYVSGTTRVRHALDDATGKLSASAYRTVTGDSIVVMVLNPSADTYHTTLSLPFNTLGGTQVVTTETQNVRKTSLSLDAETHEPVADIEPWSVSTYIYTISSQRDDLPEIDPAAVTLFSDNFDLYGASCIPDGWRSKSEEGVRKAGNYSLGPRLMGFSPEGAMTFAFYFRTDNAASGYVSYGEETAYRLALEPGQYSLSYSVVGWKATPTVMGLVQTTGGSTVKSLNSTPEHYVSSSGSSVRITQTTDRTLDFEISETGNYVLKWAVSRSTGGLNEVLVGNVRLVRHTDTDGIDEVLIDSEDACHTASPHYDLMGRPATPAAHNITVARDGIYVIEGQKVR